MLFGDLKFLCLLTKIKDFVIYFLLFICLLVFRLVLLLFLLLFCFEIHLKILHFLNLLTKYKRLLKQLRFFFFLICFVFWFALNEPLR